MWIEYLERHRTSLLTKLAISSGLIALLALTVMAGIILDPVLQAALSTFIFSMNPIGFSFLLLTLLLVSGLLCTVLWFGVEYPINQLKIAARLGANSQNILLKETSDAENEETFDADKSDAAQEEWTMILPEDEEESDEEEKQSDNVDAPIEAFELQSKIVIANLQSAALPLQANEQASIDAQLKDIGTRYRKLAIKYHPDKYRRELSEDEKKLKGEHFHQLNEIYENVNNARDALKKRIEQCLQSPMTQAYQEHNELSRKTVDLLQKKHDLLRENNNLSREYIGLSREYIGLLEKCNALLIASLAMLERHAADHRKQNERRQKLKQRLIILDQKFESDNLRFKDKLEQLCYNNADIVQKNTEEKFRRIEEMLLSSNREESEESMEEVNQADLSGLPRNPCK